MNSKAFLFSSWRSSCSYRVRICLNFKEIPYEIKPVNLVSLRSQDGSQNGEELKKNNPMKYVPALQIDGHTLVESLAIMHYLEETRPNAPLLPQDAYKRAQVRAICDMIVSGIQPLQNIGVLNYMGNYLGDKEKAWSQHWIERGFKALETLLTESAGKYCVGDEISMADCCLVPQVFNARRFHVDIKKFPNVLRIDFDLHKHAAFRRAHPMMQDDFPGELLTDPSFFQAKL